MKKELSIQVFSVRDKLTTAEQTADTFKALASYGYTGIQTAGAFTFGVEEYAKLAKDAGLKVIGTHLKFTDLEDIEETVRIHKILDTKCAGIGSMPGLWGGKSFNADVVKNFIESANKLIPQLQKHGLTFTYHHHANEFAKIGNDTIMDILLKELDKNTSYVLDTHWLQAGGVSIIEWLKKCEGRVKILHLKDYAIQFGTNNRVITELGSGTINFKEIIKVAEECGVEHLCYEQDNAIENDSLASAKLSAENFFSII